MTVNAKVSVFDMVEEANKVIDTVPVDEAVAMHGAPDVVFVDLRDVRELEREGRVPGAFHMPRGMVEFWVDPNSPLLQIRRLRRGQALRVLLQQGLALGARDRGRAANRTGACVPHRRRVYRMEGGGRADRGVRTQEQVTGRAAMHACAAREARRQRSVSRWRM